MLRSEVLHSRLCGVAVLSLCVGCMSMYKSAPLPDVSVGTALAPPMEKALRDLSASHPDLVEYLPNKGEAELVAYTPEKAAATAPAARVVIYNATLTVAVVDVEASVQIAEALAAEVGGYVQKVQTHSVTIRIPAAEFRRVIDKLGSLGAVTEKNIEAQDVTEEYIDLKLRLANARAMQKRLEELLAKAASVKDTLEVEKELNRVRGEIERLEGKINYLSSQAAFSTITVQFAAIQQSVTRGKNPALPFHWLRELGVESLIGTR